MGRPPRAVRAPGTPWAPAPPAWAVWAAWEDGLEAALAARGAFLDTVTDVLRWSTDGIGSRDPGDFRVL